MLKFTGFEYTFDWITDKKKYEVIVDTSQDFSVTYENDMVTIFYQDGYITLSIEGFKCEGVIV